MAYMNQEKKAKIAAKLKEVVPPGWKYSLRVRDLSVLIMTISAAPVDLVEGIRPAKDGRPARDYFDVVKWSIEEIQDQDLRVTMTQIMEALNLDNFDESDSQSDYFHVGHYVRLKVGSDVKGFRFISGV